MSLTTGWPAPVHDAGLVWVEKLRAAGITAYNDPRSATPPCVLVQPSERQDTDGLVPCGLTVSWNFALLAPGSGNADAWLILEQLDHAVRGVVGYRATSTPTTYPVGDGPPLPAFVVVFDENLTTL